MFTNGRAITDITDATRADFQAKDLEKYCRNATTLGIGLDMLKEALDLRVEAGKIYLGEGLTRDAAYSFDRAATDAKALGDKHYAARMYLRAGKLFSKVGMNNESAYALTKAAECAMKLHKRRYAGIIAEKARQTFETASGIPRNSVGGSLRSILRRHAP